MQPDKSAYQLGIPRLHYRRATQVLGWEHDTPIEYNAFKQDDGFWLFSFPQADEYDFTKTKWNINNRGRYRTNCTSINRKKNYEINRFT